ncbi:MAG: alpha/beta fold hydrolase [Pseudomonadota bacterium]
MTGIKSGVINVPEFEGSTAKIRVAYFLRPAKPAKETQNQIPVLVLNGGPGVSSHDMMKEMIADERLDNIYLVFMDQRGTGCSTAYPDLQATDINKSHHWGSQAIVNDAEALRSTLFPNQKWKLFGHSYGGLVSYRYISNSPSSLAGVTIYGYSPTYSSIQWLISQTVFIEDQSRAYLALYPEDKSLLAKLRTQIEKDTCLLMRHYEICGDAMLDALGQYLAFNDHWSKIHAQLHAIDNAWGTRNEERAMKDLSKMIFSGFAAANEGIVQNAISNYEIVPGYTPHQAYREVAKQLQKNQVETGRWLFNPIYYMQHLEVGDREVLFEDLTSDPISIEAIEVSLRQHPELKVNLFAGKRDGIVPPSTFNDINSAVGDLINFSVINEAGHNHFLHDHVINVLNH